LDDEELKTVWDAAVKQGYPHGTIVQFLTTTGQRRSEIANLRRPWIDEKERTITLPAWLTKNNKEHTFPYGDLTAAILETVPRYNSTELLFPSKVSDERPLSGGANTSTNWPMGLRAGGCTTCAGRSERSMPGWAPLRLSASD
jgi:integrase